MTDDATSDLSSIVLDLPGFRVLAATVYGGELEVARTLGAGWHTVMRAATQVATPLIEDAGRLVGVSALGVDEHAWQRDQRASTHPSSPRSHGTLPPIAQVICSAFASRRSRVVPQGGGAVLLTLR